MESNFTDKRADYGVVGNLELDKTDFIIANTFINLSPGRKKIRISVCRLV